MHLSFNFFLFFYRKDRYNLAKIEYLPFLLHSSNPGATIISANPTYVPQFHVSGSSKVGGEVDGQETLRAGEYLVERDINVSVKLEQIELVWANTVVGIFQIYLFFLR